MGPNHKPNSPQNLSAAAYYSALDRLGQVLLRPDAFPVLLDHSLSVIKQITGSDAAWLIRGVDPDAAQARVVRFDRDATDPAVMHYQKVPVDGSARSFMRQVLDAEGCLVQAGDTLPSWPLRHGFQISSRLTVALWLNTGGPWLLGLDRSPQAPGFGPDDERLMEAASDRLAAALELRVQMEGHTPHAPADKEESEQRLTYLLNSTPDIVCFKDPEGRWLQTNDANLRMWELEGIPYEGRTDLDLAEFVHPKYRPALKACVLSDDQAWQRGGMVRLEEHIETPDGRIIHLDVLKVPCFYETGERRGLIVIGRDVSTQRALLADQRIAAAAMEHSAEAVLVLDVDGHILQANSAYEQLCGRDHEQVRGCWIGDTLSVGLPSELGRSVELARSARSWAGEVRAERVGEPIPIWVSINLVEVAGEHYFILNAADISQLRDSEAAIAHMASHDPLTGLLNRSGFESVVEDMLQRGASVQLCAIDLVDFKAINDSLSNAAGDAVLAEVAHRLRRAFGPSVPIARTGGDEFAIALNTQLLDGRASLSAELQGVRTEPIKIGKLSLALSWCVGLVQSPDGGKEAAVLLRNAGAALNRAKAAGPGSMRRYASAMTANATERMNIESQLRVDVKNGGPAVAYQPVVSRNSHMVAGVEALARWPKHATDISPERFVHLAEESGLIIPLGESVMREACLQGKRWLSAGVDLDFVAVNISGRQVDEPGFFARVTACLEETGLPSNRLVLELTESVLMERPRQALQALHSLRARGVRLAIDDFGTGFSSLSHLKHLPVTKLKIDQSFVRDLPEEPQDAVIARAVTALGKSLGLTVVAEGVETEAQLDFLGELGVDYLQGYLFGRPMWASQLDFNRSRQR